MSDRRRSSTDDGWPSASRGPTKHGSAPADHLYYGRCRAFNWNAGDETRAADFLEKPLDDDTLFQAIRRSVELGHQWLEAEAKLKELERRHDSLTPREQDVFALISRGLLNKQVAAELGTTERTIKAHRRRVMDKMQVQSLADLVRSASLLGIDALSSSAVPAKNRRPGR